MSDPDRPLDPTLVRELAAWLEPAARGQDDTVAADPRSTILPTLVRTTGSAATAEALLTQLAGDAATDGLLGHGTTIGEGGMGVVRVAEQLALGRTVAVKTLKPGRRDPTAALDLLREAWVTGALEHPSIVPVHTIHRDDDGLPAIVMKRIEGVDWSELCDDADAVAARFGATDLLQWNLEILIAVLHALRFAHSRGIVHRDLKPSNVMIGEFGEVYLLDWGLAVTVGDDRGGRLPRAADATALAGTPCYMAPEMLGPEHGGPLTERTDVYLAGAVLFELVTGAPPHAGDSAAEVIASVLSSRPTLPDDAPTALAQICARAMAPDPADRYPSIDELQRALIAFLRHRGAARLTALAHRQLDELTDEVGRTAGDLAGQRERVHRLLGACRFGFHEALVAWPDNAEATDGVERATAAVAEFELAAGDPRAALALLAELPAPPVELLARARAALAEAERRQAALEEFSRLHDRAIGTRTRMFISGVLGVVFISATVAMAIADGDVPMHTHRGGALYSAGILVLVAALALWARESTMKTRVNQRVVATTLCMFVAQIGLFAAGERLGIPLGAVEVLMLLVWALTLTSVVIGIDAGIWPTLAVSALAFVAALIWPGARYVAMAVTTIAFTVNAVALWRPRAA